MAVSGRHIRHDWKTFVDWEQKSVSTVCGKKSTFRYTGIPGVTPQESIVSVDGKPASGWCIKCAYEVYLYALPPLDLPDLHPYMRAMYEDVVERCSLGYNEYLKRMKRWIH